MHSDPLRLRSDLLLLLAAFIWGFAFVAQRTGVEHIGSMAFTSIRFFIGGLVLLPIIVAGERKRRPAGERKRRPAGNAGRRRPLLSERPRLSRRHLAGILVGVALFAGATLQQLGVARTTAGKGGFITSLYVVIVPLLGLALGRRAPAATWAGALLAAVGLYFLTMQGAFRMGLGDFLVLLGAFVWAVHMLLLGHFSPGHDPIKLAFTQFMVCAALSGLAALVLETTTLAGLRAAAPAILYTGVCSVGIGYTLQVVGQRHAPPADAAILMSMESVFAVLGGWLLLGEQLTARALLGCALMLAGILVSQLWPARPRAAAATTLPADR